MSDALAEVLGAMTEREASWWRSWLASPHLCGRVSIGDGGASFCVRPDWRRAGVTYELRWTHPTPAEAVEALHSRGLWPWPPGDDGAPAWWCEVCSCGSPSCAAGVMDTPPSHAAHVSVARLGADRLRAIEELTRVLRDHAGCVGARLVWRVMTHRAIRDHHERIALLSCAHAGDLATMPMSDLLCVAASRSAWSGESSGGLPALRDLHRLGVHLVALDARCIVLAVEGIGGGRG